MKPLISIIVPVYNVEEYLPKCLESILSQTLTNIEIIAVDDGSTDSSGRILDEYAKRDYRIKAVHKQNEGVSEARNDGLKYATGDFVTFVDSDDWIDPRMYEVMCNIATKKNMDIVMCGYIREFGDHSKIKAFEIQDRKIIKRDEIRQTFIRQMIGPILGEKYITENLDMHSVIWNKIYRSYLLKDLYFCNLKEIGSCEDLIFNLHAFSRAESIIYINEPFYHYRKISGNSITSHYRSNLINQRVNLIRKIQDFIDENHYSLDYTDALNNRICMGTTGLALNIISPGNNSGSFRKVRQIKDMLCNEHFTRAFNTFDISNLSFHWRAFYFFAKEKMAIPYYFMINIIRLAIRLSR